MVRRPLIFILIFLVILFEYGCDRSSSEIIAKHIHKEADDQAKIEHAFRTKQSGIFVTARGIIIKILSDDLRGRRHQRFIVELTPKQTLLIAHNIDIAPRVENVRIGDEIIFCGDYEWNDKGGAIHWTHHDPDMRRVGGWIEHNGRRYE